MYIKHEACPECRKNGRDTRGDNLAIYTNGKHCYACGYHEGTKTKEKKKRDYSSLNFHLLRGLPQKFINYYKKYGLSDDEISIFFLYSKEMDRAVFRYGDFSTCRSIENKPKELAFGAKPNKYILENGTTLVCVEDIVSTIKLNRYPISVMCLFGQLTDGQKETIIKWPGPVVFWLDKDALKNSIANKEWAISQGKKSEVIFSLKDPKACDGEFIQKKLDALPFKNKASKSSRYKVSAGVPLGNWPDIYNDDPPNQANQNYQFAGHAAPAAIPRIEYPDVTQAQSPYYWLYYQQIWGLYTIDNINELPSLDGVMFLVRAGEEMPAFPEGVVYHFIDPIPNGYACRLTDSRISNENLGSFGHYIFAAGDLTTNPPPLILPPGYIWAKLPHGYIPAEWFAGVIPRNGGWAWTDIRYDDVMTYACLRCLICLQPEHSLPLVPNGFRWSLAGAGDRYLIYQLIMRR